MSDECIFMLGGMCGRRGEERGEELGFTDTDEDMARERVGPAPPPPLPMLLPMAPYTPPGAEKSWSPIGWLSPWGVSGVPGGGRGSSDWPAWVCEADCGVDGPLN